MTEDKLRNSNELMLILAMGFACMMLWGCSTPKANAQAKPKPATSEEIDQDRQILRLTDRAAERLQVQTAPVLAGEGTRTVIPFDAVVYWPDGSSWVYVMTADLEYVRQPIIVEAVDGDTAVLSDGPPAGAQVVTVGQSEFWGFESGVGR
ncbi:MAG TPA: hypothetical protein VFR55_00040 [Dehalococcoidia bacterium]|nr:hypothetical protein [Dehalococcoidia bacterium]